MIPPSVGANAVLKPTTPITTSAVPVITTVLRRLRCRRSPSSPTSRKPTAIVMTKTSKPAMITHRLLARTWAVIRVKHLLNRLETDYGPGLAWVSRATRFGGGVLSSTRRSRFARYRFGEELIEQGLSGAHTTAGIPIDPEGGDESKGLAGLTVGWTAADQPTAGSDRRSEPAQFLTLTSRPSHRLSRARRPARCRRQGQSPPRCSSCRQRPLGRHLVGRSRRRCRRGGALLRRSVDPGGAAKAAPGS